MTQRDPGCLPAAQPGPRRTLDAATVAKIDRLVSAFRATLEQAVRDRASGEVHLEAVLRGGEITSGCRVSGPHKYPLKDC